MLGDWGSIAKEQLDALLFPAVPTRLFGELGAGHIELGSISGHLSKPAGTRQRANERAPAARKQSCRLAHVQKGAGLMASTRHPGKEARYSRGARASRTLGLIGPAECRFSRGRVGGGLPKAAPGGWRRSARRVNSSARDCCWDT